MYSLKQMVLIDIYDVINVRSFGFLEIVMIKKHILSVFSFPLKKKFLVLRLFCFVCMYVCLLFLHTKIAFKNMIYNVTTYNIFVQISQRNL